jgi:hypothetical protein
LVGKLAATFSLGVIAYMVCSSPDFRELPPFVDVSALTLCLWPSEPAYRD